MSYPCHAFHFSWKQLTLHLKMKHGALKIKKKLKCMGGFKCFMDVKIEEIKQIRTSWYKPRI